MEKHNTITVYGTQFCGDCYRAHLILKKYNIKYTNIDISNNPEAINIVLELNNGNRSVPTIVFPDGSVLVEPSNRDLQAKLDEFELEKVE